MTISASSWAQPTLPKFNKNLMNTQLLNQTLIQLSETLTRAQLLLPQTAHEVDWTAHAYVWQVRHGHGFLQALHNPRLQELDDLLSIDRQKHAVVQNTEQFVRRLPANHVLLTGARGTGKSSIIRACLGRFAAAGLRVVEVAREDLRDLPEIVDLLRDRSERFIVFCDDLTFETNDNGYKALKTTLDGSFNGYAENVLIYATSNRRHLLPEYDTDNDGYTVPRSGELHPSEVVEEKIALSERFGLWLSFYPFMQDDYLTIVDNALRQLDYAPAHADEMEAMRTAALQFAQQRGSRSARIAQHFAREWVGQIRLAGGYASPPPQVQSTQPPRDDANVWRTESSR